MSGIGNWLVLTDASRFAIGAGNAFPVDDEFLGLFGVHTLFGLEQALKAMDKSYDAGFVRKQFDANWKGAARPTVDDLV